MSHTSQRRGLDPARSGKEIIVLAMVPAQHKEMAGIEDAMSELGLKMIEHGAANWISRNFTELRIPQLEAAGPLIAGLSRFSPKRAETLIMSRVAQMSSVITAVYTDTGKVESLIKDLKGDWLARNREKGYPISIVLSGLIDDLHECCQRTELTGHTYLHSLGFFGRAQDLPSEDELALITMCGHGLIAANRVRNLAKRIRDGEITPKDAAHDIAKPCVCGIVNEERAEEIFRRLTER